MSNPGSSPRMSFCSECQEEKVKEINVQTSEDILFPEELNKRFNLTIKELTEENARLQKQLEETETRLKVLVTKSPTAMHGRASDLAASKIVELSKKIRELTAELEVTKLRARMAENTASSTDTLQKKKDDLLETEDSKETSSEESLRNQNKDLNEKLNNSNLKLCEARNQVTQLKHELKMSQKALINEVGENVPLQNVLSGKGWRGRAQQICGLQQRLSQLSQKLANQQSSQFNNESVLSLRQAEKDIRNELSAELKESKKELDQVKNKLSASKARCKVLENEMVTSREKIVTLLEKTAHDDQLINALTVQLSSFSEKKKDETNAIVKRMEQSCADLQEKLQMEKMKNNQFQNVIQNREEQYSNLMERYKHTRKSLEMNELKMDTDLIVVSQSPDNNCNAAQDVLNQVGEAERARLLELIQVLNRRLDTQREQMTQSEEELRAERQKSAKLETKVARLELIRVGIAEKSYVGSPKSSTENLNNEKIRDRIELLEEQCAALKTRIHCMTQEKQEDIYNLTCLLDEAKKRFMEGLRKNSIKE